MIAASLRLGLLPASLLVLTTVTTAQTDNGNECSCFITNGSSSAYFTYHRFHDFRNINSSLSSDPEVLTDATTTTNSGVSSSFFLDQAWTGDWEIQSWNNSDIMSVNNATVLMVNSANNIYIEKSSDPSSSYSTFLTLRTARTKTFQSAAEFDSTEQNFHYLSARFLARVVGSPGSCAGMFTYLASSPIQEADIEILTSGPRDMVQYTNQPSNLQSGEIIAEATSNATIPGGLDWSSWNTYRVDWSPMQSSWYVNGQSAANISFQVPRDPSSLILNMWSDGGPWTGKMNIHDAAYLQIQYIEIVYNTSGPYGGPSSATTVQPTQVRETSTNDLDRRSLIEIGQALGGEILGLRRERFGAVGTLGRRSSSTKGCKVVCSVDEGVNASSIGTPVMLYNNTGTASSCRRPQSLTSWVSGMILGSMIGIGLCL